MSFRARLTLSYAIFAAVLLTLVSGVLIVFFTYLSTRPIVDAVAKTTAAVEAVVAGDRGKPEAAVIADVRALRVPAGVILRVNEERRFGPDGPGGIPSRRPSPDLRRGDRNAFDLIRMLATRPRIVPTGPHGFVFIAPDLQQVRAIINVVGLVFLATLVLTLIASWWIGRWITAQAVAPLNDIAGELRRFAAGDFSPRSVATSDTSEVGQLVAAYNGAAAQVAAALSERARVEAHMRRYLGEAGHEMRTPLTVISGYLDVLERGGIHDAALRERALPTMRTQTQRLRALVERLMTLARLDRDDRGEAEIVDLAAATRDAIAEATAARGGTVNLTVDGTAAVYAEPAEIHEALINLVDNAIKYGAGSAVDVAVTGSDEVVVRVTDRGPGVTPSDGARLFERFFRGAAAEGVEGSGLGLAIVSRAAERCGGSIALENPGPGGTTFRLALPPYRAAEHDRRSPIVLG